MAGIGGMTPAVAAQVTTLLTNPLLPQQSRAFLMSPGFANATTAQQQATLAGYAQQVALAAAAPAPAAAAPTHQDNVNTAQNDAAASRIALGLPQCHCHCHFPRSLSSTQSASGSSTGSTAWRTNIKRTCTRDAAAAPRSAMVAVSVPPLLRRVLE